MVTGLLANREYITVQVSNKPFHLLGADKTRRFKLALEYRKARVRIIDENSNRLERNRSVSFYQGIPKPSNFSRLQVLFWWQLRGKNNFSLLEAKKLIGIP